MKVAALYDIHGNLPALEAVLAEIHDEAVDQIVIGGDVVPGPMPREAVDTLLGLSLPVRFIRGNGEPNILTLSRGEPLTRVPEPFHEAMRWVGRQLSAEHLAVLDSWPLTAELELAGPGRVLFCHATPRDDNEIFTRLTPEERLRPVFDPVAADLVVCGHTHMQFDREVGATRVVNAGSVGMPFGEPGAYWALLGPGGVELRHTLYDFAAAGERIRETGYPQAAGYDVAAPPTAEQMLATFEAAALG
jgi:predicted phosphodiesterase